MRHFPFLLSLFIVLHWTACETPAPEQERGEETSGDQPAAVDPFWRNATVYFLLTDRFWNGDESNDFALGRKRDGATLRSFMGGDIKGVTQKIRDGYFDSLGVTAIWTTPLVEQIHGMVDEGTGLTYGYHGYWARDWTRIDPNFGTTEDFSEMISVAHAHGIRIIMDVVINHTGPVTAIDEQWPENWVRTDPTCAYVDFVTTVECTLVENLPDVRTDADEEVDLPGFLKEKWGAEGRLEEEQAELDAFFARTGYPRAPRFYIVKWLSDWVRELGIDGFRFDTAKHIEAEVCAEVKKEAVKAYEDWKQAHPGRVPDDAGFFMVGEVYGYGLGSGRIYDYGDQQVDFFDYGFESLINFDFKSDAEKTAPELFQRYADALSPGGLLAGASVLNYVSSHDDADPFDPERRRSLEAGTKLLLSPGAVQIYYGDETARPLRVAGAEGDANLRSMMNWSDIAEDAPRENGKSTLDILAHWQKLGRFRRDHPAVGAGRHEQLQASPYLFKRVLDENGVKDQVLVGMDLPEGTKIIPVFDLFPDGTVLKDYYSGARVAVSAGNVHLDSPHSLVLLGEDSK